MYSKTQETLLVLNLEFNSDTVQNSNNAVLLGYLPEGFRPAVYVAGAAGFNETDNFGIWHGTINIAPTGEAWAYVPDHDWRYGYASISFFTA